MLYIISLYIISLFSSFLFLFLSSWRRACLDGADTFYITLEHWVYFMLHTIPFCLTGFFLSSSSSLLTDVSTHSAT